MMLPKGTTIAVADGEFAKDLAGFSIADIQTAIQAA